MKKLYDYQLKNRQEYEALWGMGVRYVLSVLPTGGGKTVVFSSSLRDERGVSVAIAHRREILSQISLALAENEVPHSIIGPEKIARQFGSQQRERLGASWVRPNARAYVASVDTLRARAHKLEKWGRQVRLWVQDEAHHMQATNKWGQAVGLFPNARGLGVTATAGRADGRSLKDGRGGVFQAMVVGPSPRELIDRGFLCDYRIFAPRVSVDFTRLKIGASGEYNRQQLTEATRNSEIVGDLVTQYLRIAPGERGATFVTDVQTAKEVAERYREKGVPAAALDATSRDDERAEAIRAMENGELLQLVNVDLFGEGFNLPAISVVSDGSKTASYARFAQRFGRMLRTSPGKKYGTYIDHVGNILDRHGLPDKPRAWSLEDGAPPPPSSTDPPLRTCTRCLKLWEGYSRTCPHCGFLQKILERSSPEQVDGDLFELDPAVLSALRGEVDRIDAPVSEIIAPLQNAGASRAAIGGLGARHRERQAAQATLRDAMAVWGGHAKRGGLEGSERQIRFYREFGVDVISAQALGRPDAEKLTQRIIKNYG